MKENISNFFNKLIDYPVVLNDIIKKYPDYFPIYKNVNIQNNVNNILNKWDTVTDTIKDVKKY